MNEYIIMTILVLYVFLFGGLCGFIQGSTHQKELDNDTICSRLYHNDLVKYKHGLTLELDANTRYIKEVK